MKFDDQIPYISHNTPSSWSQILFGEYYRDSLAYQLNPLLKKIYGFHLLKIGNLSAEIDTSHSTILHQVSIDLKGENLQVRANPLKLPFLSKSVDACLLIHTLSWSSNPKQVIREADRILIDDGWMIISGFNLYSILGLGKFIPRLHSRFSCDSNLFTQIKLIEWLSVLNYEVIQALRFQVLPWEGQEKKILSKYLPMIGCLNLIFARKRTVPLIINLEKKIAIKPQIRTVSVTNR